MSDLSMPIQHVDLSASELVEQALKRNEGKLSANGALSVVTGSRTGRSPKDRFIVKDAITENAVEWGNINQPISQEKFAEMWARVENYLDDKETFVSHLQVGSDPKYNVKVKVINEYAWHNLFVQHMFVRPKSFDEQQPFWTILSAPSLPTDPQRDGVNSDATLVINFAERKVLLSGLRYAGEMKKAMFSVLNFILPEHDILPMHCSANVGPDGDTALFFGLSGTGKTTLSADPERFLIGDDEHGWSADSVFNFEGGCYAKCIDLSRDREPVIWDAIRENTVMENVVLDDNGQPDFTDDRYTKNSRAAYPLEHIAKRVEDSRGGVPKAVVFLTCDLYGVLPPVSLLNKEQAAYHFLSGYTALVGSTEVGSSADITSTFSRCFGAPFFPRPAQVYADLLMKRVVESGAQVYLINTGWTGGGYGRGGVRFDIPTTRAVVRAALSGELLEAETAVLPGFNLRIPTTVSGVDSRLLNPQNTWSDQDGYQQNLHALITKFQANFERYDVTDDIKNAGPEAV